MGTTSLPGSSIISPVPMASTDLRAVAWGRRACCWWFRERRTHFGTDRGHASSTTTAGISGTAGDATVRSGEDARGIDPIFDKDRVKEEVGAQVAITASFSVQATTAWGGYANQQFTNAVAAGDEEAAACWAPDGNCRAIGHAVIGGLAGGTDGAIGAGASSLTAPAFLSVLIDIGVPPDVAGGLTTAYAAGLGAATGGAAGSASAFNEAANNGAQAARIILGSVELAGPVAAQRCLQSPACVQAVGAAGVLVLNSIVTAANDNGSDDSTLGDVNPHVFGGGEAGLPADTYGTPPNGGAPPPDEGDKGNSEPQINFDKVEAHSGERLRAYGLTTSDAKNAVQQDIHKRIAEGSFRVSSQNSTSYEATVNGVRVQYRVIRLPDGQLNVGTIFPLR